MSQLSDEWVQRLGPPVLPFSRKQFGNRIEEGEDIVFIDDIIAVADGGSIQPVVQPVSIIMRDRPMVGKYLWVIDEQGLKLIPELTPNLFARRKVVCHTNITGGTYALQGGELWFGDDGNVYLNYKSGRYGASVGAEGRLHRLAVLDFFRSLHINPIPLVDDFK